MAHGLILKRGSGGGTNTTNTMASSKNDGKTGIGSRRIFAPQFKLQVLDSYRNDADCKGNQRATARKYGIHRRQIQKWLQVENNLRNSVVKSTNTNTNTSSSSSSSPEARKCGFEMALRSVEHRQRDDVNVTTQVHGHRQVQQQRCGVEEEVVTAARDLNNGTHAHQSDIIVADKRVPDIPQQHTTTYNTNNIQQNYHHHHHHHHHHFDETSNTNSHHSLEFYGGSPSPLYTATVPLDFTTHSRGGVREVGGHWVAPSPPNSPTRNYTPPPPQRSPPSGSIQPVAVAVALHRPPFEHESNDSAAPIDLSLKKIYPRLVVDAARNNICVDLQTIEAPVPVVDISSSQHSQNSENSEISETNPDISEIPEIWDLSTKGIKRLHPDIEDDIIIDVSTPPTTPSISSISSISSMSSVSSVSSSVSRPIKLFKPYLDHVIEEEHPNNINADIKPIIVSSSSFNDDYYSTNNNNINTNNNNNNNNITDIKMEYPIYYYKEEHTYHQHYGTTPIINVNANNMGGVHDYYPNGGTIKQRQSYSLDFKLSAIECYYSDAICRGNQRAVASKFKIHRRQVQKWLKQEDQLRQRHDTHTHTHTHSMKPMHIIR